MKIKLDSSPFGPPESSGIYAICVLSHINGRERIMYIGAAKNIRKRVMNGKHYYKKLLDRYNNMYVYIKYYETKNYINLEKELIKDLKPILNKNGK